MFEQVRRAYQPQSMECLGCYEQFDIRSAMMMHLESGACVSRINLENIDRWAFSSNHSYDYTNHWRSYYRYRCPACSADFRVVSALFQHIEDQNCGQRVGGIIAKMLNYIEYKLLQ